MVLNFFEMHLFGQIDYEQNFDRNFEEQKGLKVDLFVIWDYYHELMQNLKLY